MKNKLLFTLTFALIAVSSNAFASKQTIVLLEPRSEILAGPNFDYPLVGENRSKEPVRLYGCLRSNDWCDVQLLNHRDRTRGWVHARNLIFLGNRGQRSIHDRNFSYHVPITSFTLNSYWRENYRRYQWYNDMPRWENRRVPHPNDRYDRNRPNPNDKREYDRDRHQNDNDRQHDRNNRHDRDHSRGPNNNNNQGPRRDPNQMPPRP